MPARIAWTALILATLYLCYFHNLGAIGFIGPDEPRYAWIARDMVESGDWVTPRLYGKPWFEKPVLYYWGAALSFKLFGVSEVAARLPSAIAALLATLALAWLARHIYGGETARWLLVFMPTTVGMIGFSHAAATDMPFSGTLSVAMVCVAVILGLTKNEDPLNLPRTPWLALVLFGFFLGLAVLAKGPAAIVLSGGGILLWAFFTRRWRAALRCLHPAAIISFCVTTLPWYALCARQNSDFLHVFLIEHNFKRYLTPEFQHLQPFWFYLPIMLIALFPWTILLVPAAKQIRETGGKGHAEYDQTIFLLLWPAFTLTFFAASQSKLPGYILPAVPPLTLLLTRSLTLGAQNGQKPRRWLIVALGLSLVAAGVSFFRVADKLPTYTDIHPAPEVTGVAVIAVVAGMVVAFLGLARRARIALFATTFLILVLVTETGNFLGKLDRGLTARRAPAEASRLWPQFSPKAAATWQLKRALAFQLNFYTHSVLPEWKPGDPEPEWLFVEAGKLQEARGLGFTCMDYLVYPAVIPCRAQQSAGRLAGFGGGGGNNYLGGGAHRQPR